MISIVSFREF